MSYKKESRQISFYDSPEDFQGIKLDPQNRWIKLASKMPWDLIDEIYAENFPSNLGREAYSSRLAFGALYLKKILKLTDSELILAIIENPYLQFFLGCSGYSSKPLFSKRSLNEFKKRFEKKDIQIIYKAIDEKAK
ncbi:MAG: transposase [Tissierellia bacterium]|nr:transposase [Tissierellia bacterium]